MVKTIWYFGLGIGADANTGENWKVHQENYDDILNRLNAAYGTNAQKQQIESKPSVNETEKTTKTKPRHLM